MKLTRTHYNTACYIIATICAYTYRACQLTRVAANNTYQAGRIARNWFENFITAYESFVYCFTRGPRYSYSLEQCPDITVEDIDFWLQQEESPFVLSPTEVPAHQYGQPTYIASQANMCDGEYYQPCCQPCLNLSKVTVAQLKAELAGVGKPTTGKKAELLERVEQLYDS